MSSKKIGDVRENSPDLSNLAAWGGLGASIMAIGYDVYLNSKISNLEIDVKRIGDDVKNIGPKITVFERDVSSLKEEINTLKASNMNHEKTLRRILLEMKNTKKALKEHKISVKKVKAPESNRDSEMDLIDDM